MIYELVRFEDLSESDISAWTALTQNDLAYSSPFFSPGFTRVVSQVRDDVWVIVGRESQNCVLFWPLQKSGRTAEPIGAPFSDYHGPLLRPETPFDAEEILEAVGLDCIRFSGIYDPTGRMQKYAREFDGAYVADLTEGAEAYFDRQRDLYPRHAKKLRRIRRKIVREVGEVSFSFDDRSREHWDTLFAWKQAQYQETGRHNVLGPTWVQNMMAKLWESDDPSCRGFLHTLTQDGRLVAAEFNLSNQLTMHGWVPAYDSEYAAFSVGNILQEMIIEELPQRNIRFYDLGVSAGHYKKYYSDYQLPVKRGTIRSSSLLSSLSGANEKIWRRVEDAHLPKVSNLLGQIRRRYDIIRSVEPSFSGKVAGITNAARNVVKGGAATSPVKEDAED